MLKKLMTWKKFEETFRPDSDIWDENYYGGINIQYNDIYWYIHPEKKKLFGTEIKVRKHNNVFDNYTHGSSEGLFHESWFEPEYQPIEFITEEDMML